MVRHMAAVVLALMFNPMSAGAQEGVITVTVLSAAVHKGPSTVTPVIGQVSRGTVLPVSRNLGSWARVAWPDTPEGVGYVHVTMGRLGPPNAGTSNATRSRRTSSANPSATTAMPPVTAQSGGERTLVGGARSDRPITHIFGVGGLVGSRSSFGATTRAWRSDRLGFQFAFTRDAMTSDVGAGRVTSIRFEPGVVYALFDHVSDYFWIRPYVGSVLSFRRQTLTTPAAPQPASDNGMGFRLFGGSELTFAGVPRFGLSAELGYHRFPTPFPEFEADRMSVSIAGHWYIK